MDHSNTEEEKKFCIRCAHLLGNRFYDDEENIGRWKCGAPENETGEFHPVSGRKIYRIELCVDQRKVERQEVEACRKEGKWFKVYDKQKEREQNKMLAEEHASLDKPMSTKKKQISLDDLI